MLADAVRARLEQQEWAVSWVDDAARAKLALLEHAYTAVVLDLGLPRGTGIGVLQSLRAHYDATPVLIVTARDRLSDRIGGLDAGADDYLVKPFQLDELVARLRAVIRRSQGRVLPVLQHGDVVLDPGQRTVTCRGERVILTVNEYRTLLTLLERRGRVVSRAQLEAAVYGGGGSIESNTVAVYIHQLRRKLGEDLIATIHGFGYCIGGANE